jgi:hypothetical protein
MPDARALVEYGVRMLFVNVMPPRLVNITNPKEVEEKISAFDQTKQMCE